ncbi:DNA helicase, ATP-dependent, RecQ type [Artemisia annua]|uniref:DNA helicase, ATP-dependent, RecQ type n=1 Tax=Artemisia annua TaxID=35608 RepID=A0A2U1NQ55_ARTAN|nr:DNA helicase, ATP-dependent, RecQ type [Artemisia annua]
MKDDKCTGAAKTADMKEKGADHYDLKGEILYPSWRMWFNVLRCLLSSNQSLWAYLLARLSHLFLLRLPFQYGTPLTYASKIDPITLDDQFSMLNYVDGNHKWDPPSLSCSCVGNFAEFSAPVERDYVRKYVQVNYMEGSDDKKWSKREFSWSKNLEVCGICTIRERVTFLNPVTRWRKMSREEIHTSIVIGRHVDSGKPATTWSLYLQVGRRITIHKHSIKITSINFKTDKHLIDKQVKYLRHRCINTSFSIHELLLPSIATLTPLRSPPASGSKNIRIHTGIRELHVLLNKEPATLATELFKQRSDIVVYAELKDTILQELYRTKWEDLIAALNKIERPHLIPCQYSEQAISIREMEDVASLEAKLGLKWIWKFGFSFHLIGQIDIAMIIRVKPGEVKKVLTKRLFNWEYWDEYFSSETDNHVFLMVFMDGVYSGVTLLPSEVKKYAKIIGYVDDLGVIMKGVRFTLTSFFRLNIFLSIHLLSTKGLDPSNLLVAGSTAHLLRYKRCNFVVATNLGLRGNRRGNIVCRQRNSPSWRYMSAMFLSVWHFYKGSSTL